MPACARTYWVLLNPLHTQVRTLATIQTQLREAFAWPKVRGWRQQYSPALPWCLSCSARIQSDLLYRRPSSRAVADQVPTVVHQPWPYQWGVTHGQYCLC
jgi:hypothetical protein